MKILIRRVLCVAATLALSGAIATYAQKSSISILSSEYGARSTALSTAQETTSSPQKGRYGTFLTILPQHFLFGPNIGFEQGLSRKWSMSCDVTGHLWLTSTPNIALKANLKYYFLGQVGKGIYARINATAGHFLQESAIAGYPFYAGGGIGLGGMLPLTRNGKWHITTDAGLKVVPPIGKRKIGNKDPDPTFSMAYYTFLSPAALIDFSIGIAYRF